MLQVFHLRWCLQCFKLWVCMFTTDCKVELGKDSGVWPAGDTTPHQLGWTWSVSCFSLRKQ